MYWVHLAWVGFDFTTLVVIGTDCIGSHKSNYHTITTTTQWAISHLTMSVSDEGYMLFFSLNLFFYLITFPWFETTSKFSTTLFVFINLKWKQWQIQTCLVNKFMWKTLFSVLKWKKSSWKIIETSNWLIDCCLMSPTTIRSHPRLPRHGVIVIGCNWLHFSCNQM